jgi:hypothetical protein
MRRRAFTLIEAALATAVLGVLLVTALNALGALAAGRRSMADRALARGLADDLLAEIGALPFRDPVTPAAAIGPDADDVPAGRDGFDDVDDYHGLVESRPLDPTGKNLTPDGWARSVTVEYVRPAATPAIEPAPGGGVLKRITIVVTRQGRELARAEMVRALAWDGVAP